MRDMRFTVCDVSKALGSVSQMCKVGHRVVFNPPFDGPVAWQNIIRPMSKASISKIAHRYVDDQPFFFYKCTSAGPVEHG